MASTYVDQSTQTEEHHRHEPHTRMTKLEQNGQTDHHHSESNVRTAIIMRLTFAIITMGLLNLAPLANELFHGGDLVPKNTSTKFLFAVLLGVCTGLGVSCICLTGREAKPDHFQRRPRCVNAVLKAGDDDDTLMVASHLGDGEIGHDEEAEEIKKQVNLVPKNDFQIWDDEAIHGLEWPVRF